MELAPIKPLKINSKELRSIINQLDFPIIELEDYDFNSQGVMFRFYKNDSHEFMHPNDEYLISCDLNISTDYNNSIHIESFKVYDREEELEYDLKDFQSAVKELTKRIQWI